MRHQYLVQHGKAVHLANADYSKPLCGRKGSFTPASRSQPNPDGNLCEGCVKKRSR